MITDSKTVARRVITVAADVLLKVPYEERLTVKALGARWDDALKSWYVPSGVDATPFERYTGGKLTCLRDTPIRADYSEKEEAKACGAVWNVTARAWYLRAGSDISRVPDKFFSRRESSLSPRTVEETFDEFARSKGLVFEGSAVPDGKIHRIPVKNGRSGARDGAYVCFQSSRGRCGWIKNFKTGFEGSFSERLSRPTFPAVSEEVSAARVVADRARVSVEAAAKAEYLIENVFARSSGSHPYLKSKGIKPYGALEDGRGGLIVPLRDFEGRITSFQRIDASGVKRYMKGGRRKGSFYAFGRFEGTAFVCEGFATGASVYEATGIFTVAAMDAGNLETVARILRNGYGQSANIIIAADDDRLSKNNPGMTCALKSAGAINGRAVFPPFDELETASGMTDFNDLARVRGKKEVGRILMKYVQAGLPPVIRRTL